MAESSQATESPDDTPIASPRTARGGSLVRPSQRWPSVRASAARKSRLSVGKGPASSKKPPMGELKIRSVSQVQTFFKERTLSKADAYIRDRTASEGHIFLKALAPEAPFLDVMALLPCAFDHPICSRLQFCTKLMRCRICSNSAWISYIILSVQYNLQLNLSLVSF